MLKSLVETKKLYGYIANYWNGGKGIVLADNEKQAEEIVMRTYLQKGYNESDLEDLQVWEVKEEDILNKNVLEVWQ